VQCYALPSSKASGNTTNTSLSFSDNSRHLHESWSTSRRTSLPKASLRSCRPIACGATALCIIGTTLSDMLKFRTPCVHRRRHGHPNWVGCVGALEGIPTLPSDSWDARGNALVTVFTSLGTKKRSEPDVLPRISLWLIFPLGVLLVSGTWYMTTLVSCCDVTPADWCSLSANGSVQFDPYGIFMLELLDCFLDWAAYVTTAQQQRHL